MRTARPFALLAIPLLLAAACGSPEQAPADVQLPEDVAPELPGEDADAGQEVAGPDTVADDTAPEVVAPSCPGGPGCACAEHIDCDYGLCLDTPQGPQCAQPCAGNCPDDFKCALVSMGAGGDTESVCVPRYGWRCDPCTASAQCVSPGHADAKCVRRDLSGAFCGSACTKDDDCGAGFACRTADVVEGGTAKQCVPADDEAQCPCSPRAVTKGLSTTCQVAFGQGADAVACAGNRTCTLAGQAPTDCDAPAPVLEACNAKDDDCDGKTDEATCDDQNPCTVDACDPKGTGAGADGCTHVPNPGLACDDGNVCTAGDVCKEGQCAPGPDVCDCAKDADCAKHEDANLCNGTLVCDTEVFPHKCKIDPKSVVACDATGDTACLQSQCVPATGKCAPTPVAAGTLCNDGKACTVSDACQDGQCVSGANICQCETTADCASKEDGNLCNGTLVCDTSGLPYTCKLDPQTIVTCDGSGDTTCAKNACNPATGKCASTPVSDGAPCDDGAGCTVGDACKAGKCTAGLDTCDCKVNADCASKEDGDLCNGTLACDTSKLPYKCVLDAATVVTCPTGADTTCSKAACTPATGKCAPKAVADATPCDDGNQCTSGDLCKSGLCAPGGSICACQADGDCAAQEDGNLCNGTLYCDKTAMPFTCKIKASTVITCPTTGDTTCQKNQCTPATGQCAPKPVTDGTPCTDGNACSKDDACKTGQCQGTQVACNDNNPCTNDACDPGSGCIYTPNSAPCEDGNTCTFGDTCAGGQCKAGPPPACNDLVKNGSETDTDCDGTGACGLAACNKCLPGKKCAAQSDCDSQVCKSGTCQQPSCIDQVKNGSEEAIDCGGTACDMCPSLFLAAGAANSFVARKLAGTAWQKTDLGVPSVDGVDLAVLSAAGSGLVVAAVRYTKLQDPLDNSLQYTVFANKTWSDAKILSAGVTTRGTPVLAATGSKLQLAFQGLDYKHYFSEFDSSSWSSVAQVGSPQAYGPVPGDLAHKSGQATLLYLDGAAFNDLKAIDRTGAWGSPVFVGNGLNHTLSPTVVTPSSGPNVFVAAVKSDQQVVVASRTGSTWSPLAGVPNAWTTHRVALAAANSQIALAFRGQDGKVYFAVWSSGTQAWTVPATVGSPAAVTTTTPALAAGVFGTWELAWVASDGTVYHTSLVNGTWAQPVAVGVNASSVALTR